MLSLHNPILTILTNVNKCYVITINNSILTINTYSITKSFLFHALYPHAMARLYGYNPTTYSPHVLYSSYY